MLVFLVMLVVGRKQSPREVIGKNVLKRIAHCCPIKANHSVDKSKGRKCHLLNLLHVIHR